MCGGPTATQEQLQTEEANFYATQIDAYKTAYSNFKDLQDKLNAQFDPILKKGPNQFGFSDAEVANLNSIATEGTARNYGAAKKAVQDSIATQGGGTSNVNQTSGQSQQIQEELASDAAGVESATQQQIQQAGYAQGHREYDEAVQGEETLAAGWNPNSFAGSATNAAGAANTEANQIAEQQQQMWGSIIGALGGAASSGLTAGISKWG